MKMRKEEKKTKSVNKKAKYAKKNCFEKKHIVIKIARNETDMNLS